MGDERHNVYAGIFADEAGQNILAHSMAQIEATLGVAWHACKDKECRDEVFHKCMDLVDTWNDRTFTEEAEVFMKQPRASDCWRTAFTGYVRQIYRGSKLQVRASIPRETVYVQALLQASAKDPFVRSGTYFECASPLDRKDAAMGIIRSALGSLCDEFVYLEEPAPPVYVGAPPMPDESEAGARSDVSPDDSASQSGRAASKASTARSARQKHDTKSDTKSDAPSDANSESDDGVEKKAPPKSVTVMTTK